MNMGNITADSCQLNKPFVAAAALTAALHSSVHRWKLQYLVHVHAAVCSSQARAAAADHEPSVAPEIRQQII